jgi:hypothetical protein
MFPSNTPVFVRIGGFHHKVIAGKFEAARKVFPDEGSHYGALHVKGKGVRVFVNLVGSERSFVTALCVLELAILVSGLRIAVHDLDRHVPVARVDEQAATVGFVNFSVGIRLFERDQSPRTDKAVLRALSVLPISAGGYRRVRHREKQQHKAEGK